jgi:hypothetical protein
MISIPQLDAKGRQIGTAWQMTPEETAALPPPPAPPVPLDQRVAALELQAQGAAPDYPSAVAMVSANISAGLAANAIPAQTATPATPATPAQPAPAKG